MQNAALKPNQKPLVLASASSGMSPESMARHMRRILAQCGAPKKQDAFLAEENAKNSDAFADRKRNKATSSPKRGGGAEASDYQ